MKKQNNIRAAGLLLVAFMLQSASLFAGGSIMGRVTDPDSHKPVVDAIVLIESTGSTLDYLTDSNGYYYASNIPAGVYTVSATVMSKRAEVTGVKMGNDEVVTINMELSVAITIGGNEGIVVVASKPYVIPLIDQIDSKMNILDGKDIKEMAVVLKVSDIAITQAATIKVGNDYYVRGSRAGAMAYYIDGGKVMGSPDIPLCGLDNYRMYSGHVPAKYGDALGGIVVIETRNYFSE
ncbi:MAG TPA: carboxypeptidase-like regulatory domain-containing protein [Chitinophagales bacterium]|nr:carboxypeptidase-like regulatory domain-containing protein [Chitinophagales bacterium]